MLAVCVWYSNDIHKCVNLSPLKSVTLSQIIFVLALLSKDGETEHHNIRTLNLQRDRCSSFKILKSIGY